MIFFGRSARVPMPQLRFEPEGVSLKTYATLPSKELTHNGVRLLRFAAAAGGPCTFTMAFALRLATHADIPVLRQLIERSVRELQIDDYTPRQLDYALRLVYGVDTQLIADGTYFAVEDLGITPPVIVACGGWSKRRTLFGGDAYAARQDSLLNPQVEPAKIRAFFVHPEWARRGIGSILLTACEEAAIADGFTRLEMGATLTGVPFYRTKGYAELETIDVPLEDGEVLPIVRMARQVP